MISPVAAFPYSINMSYVLYPRVSLPWIGGDGGGEGVRAFLDFLGDFGSMMIGGGEVGRFDL